MRPIAILTLLFAAMAIAAPAVENADNADNDAVVEANANIPDAELVADGLDSEARCSRRYYDCIAV